MVPLRLMCGTKSIWTNPTPSSPRFCRPIRIRFVKESNDITNDEIKYIEQQAKELQKTKLGDSRAWVEKTQPPIYISITFKILDITNWRA